jgi:hypothetical protein
MPLLTPPPQATPPARLPGEGLKAQARVELSNATRALIKALSVLREVQSDEAQAALGALKLLAKVTPDVDDAVGASEVKSLMAGAETAKPGIGAGGAGSGPSMPIGPMGPRPVAAAGLPFGPMGG